MKQILPDENCLTPEQILRYLRDEATPVEIRAIDRHLEQCSMCSDAVDGAMMLNSRDLDKMFLQSTVPYVERRALTEVPIKPLKKGRSAHFYIRTVLGIAASLAVLIAVSMWIFTKPLDNSSSDLAEAPPQYKPEISAADSIYFAQKPTVLEPTDPSLIDPYLEESPSTSMSDNPISSTEMDETFDNQSIRNDTSLNMSIASAPMPQSAPQADAYKPAPSYPQSSKEKQSQNAEESVSNNAADERKMAKSRNAPMSSLEKATPAPSVGAPFVANRQTLENIQKVDKGILNEGIQNYQKKEYDQAIKSFNSLLTRHSKGELYENALWYVANAYNQKNNKVYAQLTFQRIVQEKGQFAPQAEAILKNLKE